MTKFLRGGEKGMLPFAPPFLVHGDLVIAQSANVCAYVAARHGLVPKDEASRAQALEVQLTIADCVAEVHDVHHPIASSLYYEDQKPESLRRARCFVGERIPKFLGWLERILERGDGDHLIGSEHSYADLSAFQLVEGFAYAFPKALGRVGPTIPRLLALRARVAARPRIESYLASPRRLPFNTQGIFRHYPELDVEER